MRCLGIRPHFDALMRRSFDDNVFIQKDITVLSKQVSFITVTSIRNDFLLTLNSGHKSFHFFFNHNLFFLKNDDFQTCTASE